MMTTMSRIDLFKTGGKNGNKAGLGFTKYPDGQLRKVKRPPNMDVNIDIYGVRAGQKFRILGGFSENIFFLLWFDPNHKIIPA